MKLLVALLMLGVSLAGCAVEDEGAHVVMVPERDPPSAAVFDVLSVAEEWVAASDGKRMHHAVFRPDTDTPVPVFINFSPYWGDTAETGGDAFSQYMIDEYVPRGYAVVLAALRGTGHSEGCFQIGGDRELQDMYEVIDHYATQPWSNGLVATGGKSYDSSPTNGLIAKFPHPALRGVFHVSGITDMYAYNYHQGVPYATGPVFNTYYFLQGTDEYGASLVGAGSTDDEDVESLARVIDDAACTEFPQMQASGVGSGVHGLKDAYWIERDWTRTIGASAWDGSIFFVHGLQDWNVKPDHILPWIENLPPQIKVKGWLHQGGHVYPERTDWNATMLAWLDHELKGHDNGFWEAPNPRWEVRSDNGTWYNHPTWPAPVHFNLQGSSTGVSNIGWPVLADEAPLHLSGEIVVKVRGDATGDAVLSAVVYDEAPGGSRAYVTEAFLRTIYADGLDGPSTTAAFATSLHTYPFDHIFLPGHIVRIVFQEAPRQGVVLPHQLEPVRITNYELGLPIAFAAEMEQPADMRCFAC